MNPCFVPVGIQNATINQTFKMIPASHMLFKRTFILHPNFYHNTGGSFIPSKKASLGYSIFDRKLS